jgi:hypothetical protein
MKIDFKDIISDRVNVGSIFYLYGNYKKTFEIFCDFVQAELRRKNTEPRANLCSVAECLKLIDGQCDLFEASVDCFCIRNVEDSHLEKMDKIFSENRSVFVLESGHYLKSKKITDYFLKSKALAIASFDNEITKRSLAKMLFPNASALDQALIAKIISNSSEELYSLVKKISILLDCGNLSDLENSETIKRSFLSGLDLIPLIRFLMQSSIKEKISSFSADKNSISRLLNAELAVKSGKEVGRGYVYLTSNN